MIWDANGTKKIYILLTFTVNLKAFATYNFPSLPFLFLCNCLSYVAFIYRFELSHTKSYLNIIRAGQNHVLVFNHRMLLDNCFEVVGWRILHKHKVLHPCSSDVCKASGGIWLNVSLCLLFLSSRLPKIHTSFICSSRRACFLSLVLCACLIPFPPTSLFLLLCGPELFFISLFHEPFPFPDMKDRITAAFCLFF